MPSVAEIPLQVIREASQPPTGIQLHGAVSSVLGHQEVSVWPLLSAPGDDGDLILRLGWLGPQNIPGQYVEPHREWRIGSLMARAAAARVASTTYESMVDAPPASAVTIRSVTPTLFKRSAPREISADLPDRTFPLPDPHLIFRGLISRWNQRAAFTVSDSAAAELLGSLELVDFDIHPERALLDRAAGGDQDRRHRMLTGYVGTATIALMPRAAPRNGVLLAALTRFAAVAGVGWRTGYGFGACTVEVHRPEEDDDAS